MVTSQVPDVHGQSRDKVQREGEDEIVFLRRLPKLQEKIQEQPN